MASACKNGHEPHTYRGKKGSDPRGAALAQTKARAAADAAHRRIRRDAREARRQEVPGSPGSTFASTGDAESQAAGSPDSTARGNPGDAGSMLLAMLKGRRGPTPPLPGPGLLGDFAKSSCLSPAKESLANWAQIPAATAKGPGLPTAWAASQPWSSSWGKPHDQAASSGALHRSGDFDGTELELDELLLQCATAHMDGVCSLNPETLPPFQRLQAADHVHCPATASAVAIAAASAAPAAVGQLAAGPLSAGLLSTTREEGLMPRAGKASFDKPKSARSPGCAEPPHHASQLAQETLEKAFKPWCKQRAMQLFRFAHKRFAAGEGRGGVVFQFAKTSEVANGHWACEEAGWKYMSQTCIGELGIKTNHVLSAVQRYQPCQQCVVIVLVEEAKFDRFYFLNSPKQSGHGRAVDSSEMGEWYSGQLPMALSSPAMLGSSDVDRQQWSSAEGVQPTGRVPDCPQPLAR